MLLAVLLTVLAWRLSNRALFIWRKESAHGHAAAAARAHVAAADGEVVQHGGGGAHKRRSLERKRGGEAKAAASPPPVAEPADATAAAHSDPARPATPAQGGGAASSAHSRGSSSGGGSVEGCWSPELPVLQAEMAHLWRASLESPRVYDGPDPEPDPAWPQPKQQQQQQHQQAGAGGEEEGDEAADAAPPSVAEAKLAYAPPQKRPAPPESPDLGDGAVDGLPVGKPAGGAPPPPPEVAAAALAGRLERVRRAEAVQLPPWHIIALLAMCAMLLLTSLLSKREACGSPAFWGVQAAAVPVLLGMSALSRWDVLRKARVKKAAQVGGGLGGGPPAAGAPSRGGRGQLQRQPRRRCPPTAQDLLGSTAALRSEPSPTTTTRGARVLPMPCPRPRRLTGPTRSGGAAATPCCSRRSASSPAWSR
jgi:hypothetical protein